MFSFFSAHDLPISANLVDQHSLSLDPYVTRSKIYRGGARFNVESSTQLTQKEPDLKDGDKERFLYELSAETNSEVTSSRRSYNWLARQDFSTDFYDLAKAGILLVSEYYAVGEITVQALQYRPTLSAPCLPTPSSVHHDEIEFTSVTVFERKNVEGDWFILTDRSCIGAQPQDISESHILTKSQLNPLSNHTIIFNDSQFGHAVLPIQAIEEPSTRTVLLIDYLRSD